MKQCSSSVFSNQDTYHSDDTQGESLKRWVNDVPSVPVSYLQAFALLYL